MIRVIQGFQRSSYPREMDAMHRLRRRVFHERMGWDVAVIRQWEIDGFDVFDPLYLLSIDHNDRVVGTLRLLPTMGFTMINDVFSNLLPDGTPIQSPLIWESSRFAVDHEADVPIGPNGMSRAAAELGLAMNEIGMRLGLSHIVTVYDAMVHRALRKARCAGDPIGPPQRIGGTMSYAVFYEVSAETERNTRAASGIMGPVLEDQIEPWTQLKVA